MAWSFCGHCGTPITWGVGSEGRPETRHRCTGCGRELYRNPEVHVLCLVHKGDSSVVGLVSGQLIPHEPLHEVGNRLLVDQSPVAGAEGEMKLFGIVNDFDRDCIFIVLRARVADPGENLVASEFGAWVPQLARELRGELERGRHQVHAGVVRGGQLQLTPEKMGQPDVP